MKKRDVDVLVLGAGSAGLSAVKILRETTDNFLLVDRGPLGTTCSRVGCMPSKALIELANQYHSHVKLQQAGLWRGDGSLLLPNILKEMRRLRNCFVGQILETIEGLGERFLEGEAKFLDAHRVAVGDSWEITAKKIVLATGSHPNIPKEWRSLGAKLVTTDDFFELEDWPNRIGVIGLGPLGIELGQAMARLGRKVFAYGLDPTIAGLKDPELTGIAADILRRDMSVHVGEEVKLKSHPKRDSVLIEHARHETEVDLVLCAVGRTPNLEGLDIEKAGLRLDEKKKPRFDRSTMAAEGAPHIFLAGDFTAAHPILHEATDDGQIAGYNAAQKQAERFQRRTPLTICFTTPNIASVGEIPKPEDKALCGTVYFKHQGRSVLKHENQGCLHLYAEPKDGRLLGAEMMATDGEHLAHVLSWAIASGLTAKEALSRPFYHPTVEESLRTALKKIEAARNGETEHREPELQRQD